MAAFEPRDRVPENSLESLGENVQENGSAIERDENQAAAEICENAHKSEDVTRSDEIVAGGSLVGFERIEVSSDLPEIPENLSRTDFEKLFERMSAGDGQLERGTSVREILAPLKRYVELTRRDNEFRLVEEEHAKTQAKVIVNGHDALQKYRFVGTRKELREFDEDSITNELIKEQSATVWIRIPAIDSHDHKPILSFLPSVGKEIERSGPWNFVAAPIAKSKNAFSQNFVRRERDREEKCRREA